jgi:hypothetical protein
MTQAEIDTLTRLAGVMIAASIHYGGEEPNANPTLIAQALQVAIAKVTPQKPKPASATPDNCR